MNTKKTILLFILIVIDVCLVLFILLGLASMGAELAFWYYYAIPLTILTPIIYGIGSYLITKKMVIPHLLMFGVWFVELCIIYYILDELNTISILLEFLFVCAILSLVSLASAAITKSIFPNAMAKRTDKNHHIQN